MSLSFEEELAAYKEESRRRNASTCEADEDDKVAEQHPLCRNGPGCKYFKQGRCKFRHPPLTCNLCGETGHITTHCPRAFCRLCKQVGHITRNCTIQQRRSCVTYERYVSYERARFDYSLEKQDNQRKRERDEHEWRDTHEMWSSHEPPPLRKR